MGSMLDLSKAFDCVNHALLLSKTRTHDVRGCGLNWINSDREQYVSVTRTDRRGRLERTYSSTRARVNVGMPQGSLLGFVLFMYFKNSIKGFVLILFGFNGGGRLF